MEVRQNNSDPEEIVWEESTGKSWWRQRTNLERKLIIVLTAAGVLALGCLLYAAVMPSSTSSTTCSSPECLTIAAKLLETVNPDIDPCEDFFKFACGKFHEFSLQEDIQHEMQEILEKPINSDDHYLINSQKKFYHACMNETGVEISALNIFKETLKDLNDWPVVVGHRWKEKHFEWTGMINKLRRRGYFDGMIVNLAITVDPEDRSKFILNLEFPYLSNIKNEHKELYVDYMADVAELFGADSNRAAVEMEKVLDFREKLGEINQRQWERFGVNQTFENSRVTIRKFNEYFDDDIDWLNYINTILPADAKLSLDDFILVPDSDCMEDFITLMYKTSLRTQANYIIWSVIETLMPILSDDLQDLYENYNCLTDASPRFKNRFELCQALMHQSYNPAPSDILYAREKISPDKKEQVETIVDYIKSEIEAITVNVAWMNDDDKVKITEIMNNLTYIVGSAEDYFDDSLFERFEKVKTKRNEGDNFLNILLNRKKYQRDAYYSAVRVKNTDTVINGMLLNYIAQTQAMLLLQENMMVLPIGLLQGLRYNSERPMYFNYGGLGVQISDTLVLGLILEYDYWSESTVKTFQERIECLKKYLSVDHDGESKMAVLRVVADLIGIRVARSAYQSWIEKNGKDSEIIGVNYTPNQLFWISALLSHCYYKNDDCDASTNALFQTNLLTRNNPDFAQDFNCPTYSEMDPFEKCLKG